MWNRDIEDAIYDQVAAELANNDIQPGLMAKAAAKAKGDNNLAKSLYIEFRAEQLSALLKNKAGERQRAQQPAPLPPPKPPDTPIRSFTITGPSSDFYRLVAREHTLCFLSTNRELILDPQRGDYGLELYSPLIKRYPIVLINQKGDRFTFRAMDNPHKAVKFLKLWWRERGPR